MSEQTPSQAEGERDDVTGTSYDPPRTTPSQAEGEREDDVEDVTQAPPGEDTERQRGDQRTERQSEAAGSEAEGAEWQRGYARAGDEEEPGAHSGQESQARERVVPGTASAAEGYGPAGGTASGEPLTGVEQPADERER
ncbi:hypothetical protein [Streptomyces sp. JB150]|uniref:hypothetical protein n=1 Tax=Streptomyces sp. JB150 TaxID=2714844 RepID=UPI001F0D794A|nr:hypothetical protein [Streptomyces sp. JB150]